MSCDINITEDIRKGDMRYVKFTYTNRGKIYNFTVTSDTPSDNALRNLAKKIFEIIP